MTTQMISYDVLCIIGLPADSDVSYTISLHTIMAGGAIYFNKHYRIEFGAYPRTRNSPNPANFIQYRTNTCICLVPTGNIQGSYWFLNLCTSRQINSHKFTPLPVPTHIIYRVHELTDEGNQKPALGFYDIHGNPIKYYSIYNPVAIDNNYEISGVDEIDIKY